MPPVLTHAAPRVVLLEQRGRFLVGEPFFQRGRRATVERSRDARPGRLALLHPNPKGGRFKIARVLGRPDVARDVIEALMLDRGLRRSFPPGVERAAQDAHPPDVPRRDLTALPTFTIDPVTARDFDDAISCEALGGDRWRVWVHIADVSAHVRPGGAVEREAYRRSTSVYVPGAVEPMLPEALSNDACSLRPGVERLAVTVELELRGAETVKSAFYRSLIRSDERLDYDRVDRIFAGEDAAQDPWGQPLAAARAAAAALQARRESRGALAVESVEPEFAFDRRGHLVSAIATAQTESHRLIEHLMIAANEAVATLLSERAIPALYRVHERPEPQSAQRLVEQLASLDIATPPVPDPIAPSQAADIVAQCAVLVDQHVRRTGHGRQALTTLVLRSLKQARYSPVNLGHAGLQSTHYCHFTSPIRRYPDLVCHRALLSAVGGGEDAPRPATLDEAAEWTSGRERDAMVIERDADDVARCFLLERDMFEGGWDTVYAGEVTGLIGAGAFVTFGEGYQGMLPVRRLRGDWWELNEHGTMLVGERTDGVIRLGDPVTVAVRQVDAPRGRVDLDLVGIPAP
ncbi:MAG TPA: RNB domain-containing ribonuclease [Solirubrobacteraceae bacterium]|nr:RNB domain-containing ribonuclease [Solirubrobacteraceae bacterium]